MSLLNPIPVWYWFILAATLITIELTVGTSFFVLWLGISAAVTGLVELLYPTLALEYQFFLFTTVSITCLVLWAIRLKKVAPADTLRLNRRSEQYIGRSVVLLEPITNGRGRIHIDDSFWRIQGPDLPAGATVQITGANGAVLIVAATGIV